MLDQVLQGQTGALAENLGGIDEHRILAAFNAKHAKPRG